MSNQINEGAARYNDNTSSHSGEGGITEGNSNLPERSAAQGTQSPQQLVTDHLDLWTSTVTPKSTSGRGRGSGKSSKIELTGIKKLRELILELAVRGKLVAQNSDDEPASKLLERIEAEKAQLIKDGKLKKQKPLAPVSEDEKPFELPDGWEWSRLADVSLLVTDGVHHTPTYLDSGVPFISVKDIDGKEISFDNCKYISEEQHLEINKRCNPEYGDLLICRIGTLGRVTPVSKNIPFSLFVSVGLIKTPKTASITQYFHSLLNSPVLYRQYDEIKAGGSHTNKLNLGDIPKLKLPLPPLAEQQRIIAKVDELMALCDQLEQQSEHQLTAHQQLTDTLLATLTDSADAQELNDNWQRLANHFDLLFSGPMGAWAIDRLKDTILQLAVMGKLVPQNPDDEPASKLLERIEEEKAQLVKEGKIKKPKKLPPVRDEEKPFELPEGWEWENLGSLVVNMDSGWSPACPATPAPDERTWGVLKTTAVQRMKYLEEENKQLPSEKEPRPEYEVNAGDILITRAGPKNRVGISCLVKISRPKLMISDKIIRFHLASPASCGEFITLCLNAGATADYLERSKSGMAESQMNISQGKLLVAPIALPPLAEQQRIVAKVDELFALCDQLKDHLQQASETEQHLTNAIVEQALG